MKNKNEPLTGKEFLTIVLLCFALSLCATIMSGKAFAESAFRYPEGYDPTGCTIYRIPQNVLDADPDFSKLIAEANKYIGYPYVYGGSTPETSFDCSGFVSWVFTQSGVCDVGRLGANGLHKQCEYVPSGNAKPGDLIFFTATTKPNDKEISHVGIFVGSDWMIHCGNPIEYVDLSEHHWALRFHSFGRLPRKSE